MQDFCDTNLTKGSPHIVSMLLFKGFLKKKDGKIAEADSQLKEILKYFPKNLHQTVTLAKFTSENALEMMREALAALETVPESILTNSFEIAKTYYNFQKYNIAIIYFRKASRLMEASKVKDHYIESLFFEIQCSLSIGAELRDNERDILEMLSSYLLLNSSKEEHLTTMKKLYMQLQGAERNAEIIRLALFRIRNFVISPFDTFMMTNALIVTKEYAQIEAFSEEYIQKGSEHLSLLLFLKGLAARL
jgi:tetratricopeptide (TPR) repeat protein